MLVEAIEKPNRKPNNRNITTFEFPTPAKAASPKYLPTQIAFIEPLTDCRTLPNRIGRENASRARGIDPSVNENLGGTNSPNCLEYRRASIIDHQCPRRASPWTCCVG